MLFHLLFSAAFQCLNFKTMAHIFYPNYTIVFQLYATALMSNVKLLATCFMNSKLDVLPLFRWQSSLASGSEWWERTQSALEVGVENAA